MKKVFFCFLILFTSINIANAAICGCNRGSGANYVAYEWEVKRPNTNCCSLSHTLGTSATIITLRPSVGGGFERVYDDISFTRAMSACNC
jgi:hypothetical protein